MHAMKKLLILGAVVFGMLTAVWLVDPFLIMAFILVPALYFGIPGVFVALVYLLFARATSRPTRPAIIILAGIATFGAVAAIIVPANGYVHDLAVREAQAFPSLIESSLENYRSSHGHYPKKLSDLSPQPNIPRLLRTDYGYQSDGNSYTFSFSKPGGLIDLWRYSRDSKRWWLGT